MEKDTVIASILLMKDDSVKVNKLLKQAELFGSDNPKKELHCAELAMELSQKISWEQGQINALLFKAKSLDYLSEYKKAMPVNLQALKKSIGLHYQMGQAKALRQIGGLYQVSGDYGKAIALLKQSYAQFKMLNYKKGMANCLHDIGTTYYEKSDYVNAIHYIKHCIVIKNQIGQKRSLIISYSQLGSAYSCFGNFQDALSCFTKSLRISKELNNQDGIVRTYNYMADNYRLQNKINYAIYYYEAAFKMATRIDSKENMDYYLMGLAECYKIQGNLNESLRYMQKSYSVSKQQGFVSHISLIVNALSNLYYQIGAYDSCLFYAKKNLEFTKKTEDVSAKVFLLNLLSKVYLKRNELSKARSYLNQAEVVLKNNSLLLERRDWAEINSELLLREGKAKEALKAYQYFILLRDSVLSHDKKTALSIKEANFEFVKKSLTDSIKNSQMQKVKDLQIRYRDAQIKEQHTKQNALVIGMLLSALLGWLFYSRFKAVSQQKKAERKLLLIEKEQALLEERNRIADEMHDDVGADLSNLLLKIRMNEQKKLSGDAIDMDQLKNATRNIIHKIDEVIWSLNAQRDTLKELVDFMSSYHKSIQQENNLQGQFLVEGSIPTLNVSAQCRRSIFLAFKEILNNALKHSMCNRIEVKISLADERLVVQIKDNGKGFDTSKAHQGNGLKNLQKRMTQLKGEISFVSQQPSGTNIEYKIPLSQMY